MKYQSVWGCRRLMTCACLALMSAMAGPAVQAQEVRSAYNVPMAEYPKVNENRQVLFRIKAPQAQKVQVDICGKKYPMTKGADGVWSVTTDALVVGFHYYFLIVDGVSVTDPASDGFYGCGRMASAVEIPEPASESAYYTYNEKIAHGQVRECRYYSRTENRMRRCHVYTPADYDTSGDETYPVLYLQHGMGEDERGWHQQGRMADILDNQIAEGKCKPMVVVMDNGNCSYIHGARKGESRDEFGASFQTVMLNDLMPYVEQTFRVKTDRDHRAMAGLSWGGHQTLQVTLSNLDRFSHIGIFSGAIFLHAGQHIREAYGGALADSTDFNNRVHAFFIGQGTEENMPGERISAMLNEAGIRHVYYRSPGTHHEWLTWRRCLNEFLPLLFRQ